MPDDDPLGPTQVSGHGEHDERQRPEGVGDIEEDFGALGDRLRTAVEDRPEFLDSPPARGTYRLEFVGHALLERSEILVPLYLFGHKNEKLLQPKNPDDGFGEKIRRALPAAPVVSDLLILPRAEKGNGEHGASLAVHLFQDLCHIRPCRASLQVLVCKLISVASQATITRS